MKKQKSRNIAVFVAMTLLSTLIAGLAMASDGAPLTPELAARREMVRKQQEQRITQPKRKAAAAALRAERLQVQKARQAAQKSTPATTVDK